MRTKELLEKEKYLQDSYACRYGRNQTWCPVQFGRSIPQRVCRTDWEMKGIPLGRGGDRRKVNVCCSLRVWEELECGYLLSVCVCVCVYVCVCVCECVCVCV